MRNWKTAGTLLLTKMPQTGVAHIGYALTDGVYFFLSNGENWIVKYEVLEGAEPGQGWMKNYLIVFPDGEVLDAPVYGGEL